MCKKDSLHRASYLATKYRLQSTDYQLESWPQLWLTQGHNWKIWWLKTAIPKKDIPTRMKMLTPIVLVSPWFRNSNETDPCSRQCKSNHGKSIWWEVWWEVVYARLKRLIKPGRVPRWPPQLPLYASRPRPQQAWPMEFFRRTSA